MNTPTPKEYDEIIEKGWGMAAGAGTLAEWMAELKQERQREDERFLKWFDSSEDDSSTDFLKS